MKENGGYCVRYTPEHPVPDYVLYDTLWDFADEGVFESRAEFEEAVYRYQIRVPHHTPDIGLEERWQPTATVLGVPRVLIKYASEPPGQIEEKRSVELVSDNGESFTGGELLHKLHNLVVEHLARSHNHRFEGLHHVDDTEDDVPIFEVWIGS